ncbi:hypothetical protein DFP72DRAFT_820090 [Ephemerocybe angulata]|uniref:PAS domain-containing protein n=1 Tax=Ephemerocybe angulata TaxID=980116 RepID=A0A8H6M079_9AGAR|nr:hypothetical protein DFP72DRAFT_820090 [Tulosesus angulatus]
MSWSSSASSSSTPCVSFIGIVDFSQEARWLYMTDSVIDLLGFEPKELIGRPSLELVHPDEFPRVRQLHYDTIQMDKAAVLVYLRLRHKDPYKGYILCGISRTVVHNVLVGSVSFASPGAKALHNASTAQEITVISQGAANFEFRRWHDPSPMPPSPTLAPAKLPPSPSTSASSSSESWSSPSPPMVHASVQPATSNSRNEVAPVPMGPQRPPSEVITFEHLPNKSFRTAFILDRFSVNCTVLYCSNDLLVESTHAIGRNFFDFVSAKDEGIVRSWIECVKGWGVNERGQPSDGGFGFGRFTLLVGGRESCPRLPDPVTPSRHRQGSMSSRHGPGSRGARHHHHHRDNHREHYYSNGSRSITGGNGSGMAGGMSPAYYQQRLVEYGEQFPVDAIFSAHSDGLMVILRRTQ